MEQGGGRRSRRDRAAAAAVVFGRCVLAGLCLCLSVPPWGWWPLAFLGVAQWDLLLDDQPWLRRFRRTWLIAVTWLFPSMLWIVYLTPPGYVIAVAVQATFFGALAAAVPPHRPARWVALPGAIVLAEILRWSWPFGGVPLSTLAMSQAAAPLAQAARLGSAIAVSGLVAVGGVALAAAWRRRWLAAGVAIGLVVAVLLVSLVAPRGSDGAPLRIALVQGGGPQGTRFVRDDGPEVFRRHLAASQLIEGPVDLVLWPENVVAVEGRLEGSEEDRQLRDLAQQLGAPVVIGTTEGLDDTSFLNASVVYLPDGTVGERFDKVHRVPFGEYVPLRPLIEKLAGEGSGLPDRDAVEGTGPAVVHTPAGTMGVAVSWEIFFPDRVSDGVDHGSEVVLNPTNGASYDLTEVQSQQVASSQLRAIESGRWVAQAAPTGFSAIVDPNGRVVDCDRIDPEGVTTMGHCRTGTEETAVLEATISRREGTTLATTLGPWPVLALAVLALAGGWVLDRRRRGSGA